VGAAILCHHVLPVSVFCAFGGKKHTTKYIHRLSCLQYRSWSAETDANHVTNSLQVYTSLRNWTYLLITPTFLWHCLTLYSLQWDYCLNEKKRSEERQTLRAGCSKAEPKIFAPPQTPFPGAQDGQNLISGRWSLPLPTNQFGEDRCTQFRVIVVTDPPPTHPPTNRQGRLQYTAPQLARIVKKALRGDANAVVRRSQKYPPCRRPPSRGRRTAKI